MCDNPSPKGQHGIRARLDAAVDHAGEVDSEEGESRVGHRIDEVLHERMALGYEFIVFPPEGYDLESRVNATPARDPVALQPAAVDEIAAPDFARRCIENQLALPADASPHPGAGSDLPLPQPNPVGHLLCDLSKVNDPRLGHVQSGNAGNMRLVVTQFLRPQPTQPVESIRLSASLQFLKRGQFPLLRGDDDFAAPVMGNVML